MSVYAGIFAVLVAATWGFGFGFGLGRDGHIQAGEIILGVLVALVVLGAVPALVKWSGREPSEGEGE